MGIQAVKYDKNNNVISRVKFAEKSKDTFVVNKEINYIFLKCNLLEDSYINKNKTNSIYRFEFNDDEIIEKSREIIYHKVTKKPNEIILKLIDSNNNPINFTSIDLWVEFNLKVLE